ncbi:hypothetical protein [Nonomuraea basaltis]|uniref:hypothetical protein n=1 Tax=Nonomuraea basaltis TaxID=2495887 RepID=UPI00110C6A1A|nr:hypothetical protein [Nonomuraea basaltis]TMR95011.1 hypothetical protein EJK15_30825 [Nonomuraea basaltis]
MADVGDQKPSFDAPTTPFRKIVLPAEETVKIPRPPAPGPSVPIKQPSEQKQPPAKQPPPVQPPPVQPPPVQKPPAKQPRVQQSSVPPPPLRQPPPVSPPLPPLPPRPPARGIGDIPIKVVYLLGAIIATVLAVVLIFVVFSGDVPTTTEPGDDVVRVAPVPTTATPAAPSPTPTVTESPIVLPPVPASKKYANLPGKASLVISTITDNDTGITYPRLASPWKARSFPPYSIAQRIGTVKMPFTVIASAKFPAEVPAQRPDSNADYREIAIDGVRWSMRTQYPKGATLEWTASQKIPVGKGWTLGYKVTYTNGGKQEVAQAMMTVIEVGRTKPTMLMASIPESNKARWRDLNTLVQQVRPL